MRKILFYIAITALMSTGLVNAASQQELIEAKQLIDSNASCKNLSDSQLEKIGEYYMEEMHSGEAHVLMHKMMGLEEGSDAEEQFHINLAKRFYCKEVSGGMMGMMGSYNGGFGGMMGIGGNYPGRDYSSFWILGWLVSLAIAIILVAWLARRFSMKKEEVPIDILKKRYANGELTSKEFEEMKKEIEK
ncbi:SHOCT domain-containing protein [Candidatus Micrarchaeota archaeon]|nr:SHOCT domain-containing protein [Candidatus Micrarchaeota archaeon]